MACTPSELRAATACCDTYSQHDLLRLLIGARCLTLQALNPMATCDFSQWLSSTNSLAGRSIHDLLRTLIGAECAISEAIGSGEQTCLLCGTEDPNETPACDCALYYKVLPDLNLELWFWDSDTTQWIQTIGGPA